MPVHPPRHPDVSSMGCEIEYCCAQYRIWKTLAITWKREDALETNRGRLNTGSLLMNIDLKEAELDSDIESIKRYTYVCVKGMHVCMCVWGGGGLCLYSDVMVKTSKYNIFTKYKNQ